jgi:hypothetical protein
VLRSFVLRSTGMMRTLGLGGAIFVFCGLSYFLWHWRLCGLRNNHAAKNSSVGLGQSASLTPDPFG